MAKKGIERKIMGIGSYESFGESGENDMRATAQNELLGYVESTENSLSLNAWINDIIQEMEEDIKDSDDGDRDNLMYNSEFATHFIRLCKLLPLWWGVSCQIFASPSVTSSSANVESYFNDLKHRSMRDMIPSSADAFVQNHMDATDDAIMTASRLYAKPIEPIVPRKENASIAEVVTEETNVDDFDYFNDDTCPFDIVGDLTPKPKPKRINNSNTNKGVTTCIACKDGNLPGGAHTCMSCGKKVHALDGCSVPYDESDEGFGSKRVCIACCKRHVSKAQAGASQDKSDEQSDSSEPETQVAKEMRYKEPWGGKTKTKQSKYMQPNPLFNLMSDTKKQTIRLLKNGNQYTRPFKVGGESFQLFNTCAPDALAQAIAGAYAYNPTVRDFYDNQSDPIVKIAISLTTK